jgi:hypothetical protein
MKVTIGGRKWVLRFVKAGDIGKQNMGESNIELKEIKILDSLKGEQRLDCVIHELLHCCGWHVDEEFVSRFANESAAVLWKLGYRNLPEVLKETS